MFNRKKLDRERMELYLVHLLLAFRKVFAVTGFLILAGSALIALANPELGLIMVIPAVFCLLLVFSFGAVHLFAKVGSWIGTLFR